MTSLITPYLQSLAQHRIPAAFPQAAPWRGILAVEPDLATLQAGSLRLTQANYCVTRASGGHELFTLRGTKALAIAILSDHLGQRHLGAVAETVRRQWPRTRILILGQPPGDLEDYLYDEQINRSPEPQQVLADLESLYSGMWNPRTNTLEWNATRSSCCFGRPRHL